jgi:hypothetical protein
VNQAQIHGFWAPIPRGADLVCHQLARYKHFYAGSLNLMDMYENIGAPAIGRDKAISAFCVEEFDAPSRHLGLPASRW